VPVLISTLVLISSCERCSFLVRAQPSSHFVAYASAFYLRHDSLLGFYSSLHFLPPCPDSALRRSYSWSFLILTLQSQVPHVFASYIHIATQFPFSTVCFSSTLPDWATRIHDPLIFSVCVPSTLAYPASDDQLPRIRDTLIVAYNSPWPSLFSSFRTLCHDYTSLINYFSSLSMSFVISFLVPPVRRTFFAFQESVTHSGHALVSISRLQRPSSRPVLGHHDALSSPGSCSACEYAGPGSSDLSAHTGFPETQVPCKSVIPTIAGKWRECISRTAILST